MISFLKAEKNELDSDIYVKTLGYHFRTYIWLIILISTEKVKYTEDANLEISAESAVVLRT